MRKLTPFAALFALLFSTSALFSAEERRLLRPADIYSLREVRDPQVSPDGQWIAYVVVSRDEKTDKADRNLWMVPSKGGEAVQLTSSPESEDTPRFSPDGRYVAFLSSREGEKTQVWLLDRRGGEGKKLTDYKADVSDLAWSPDGKKLVLVVSDIDPDGGLAKGDDGEKKAPKPIVVTRRQFKRDGVGYLNDLRDHLHVFDLASKTSVQITSGAYDDSEPAWSPDGQWIAFTSNRTSDPDANQNTDIFVVEPKGDQTPRAVTSSTGADASPSWSPDSAWIAYVAGGAVEDLWYGSSHVALAPNLVRAAPRALTVALDRNVYSPTFSADGSAVFFLIEDGGNQHLAKIPIGGGAVERVVAGEREIEEFALGPKTEIAVLESQWNYPAEISLVVAEAKKGQTPAPTTLLRRTTTNDEFLRGIALSPLRRYVAKSADGTKIDSFLTVPVVVSTQTKLPTILRIHGGPTAQYTTGWELEWQMLAAHGYAVVAANPRGSTGHGRDFARAIWADWGNLDYQDVMAAVDEAIALGVADPDRLGVGGWSYGGILTDYVITKTNRFKAATSGASETNYFANYGTDHYQYEWETELGLPWRNVDLWLKLSPWFQVEKVTTPTLILCGQEDWNVPLLNSEQLFQALKRLGKTTELIVYPEQSHGIRRPSYQVDRFERYLAWYDRFLKSKL